MAFHEVRFPVTLSFGSVGGPQRRTDIVTLANGNEERNSPWAHSKRRYDAGMGMRSLDDVQALIAFFEARLGQMYGFRWKDWSDFKSGLSGADVAFEDQEIAIGDGATRVFPLMKVYRSGQHSYARPITKPVAGTVHVGVAQDELVETVDYDVDLTTGLITFVHPPEPGQQITAGYEFDVPVRFDTDSIQANMATFHAGDVPNVPVLEVRV